MKIWRLLRWVLLFLIIAYIALIIWRRPSYNEEKRTAAAVAQIHAQRLTMADVDGKHLPPRPDPKMVDATVEGIDANDNGIRDDVELAIFNKYPDSTKIRAAELQYAMELQMYLSSVTNTDTWQAVSVESSRGYACVSQTFPRTNLTEHSRVIDERIKEVEDLIFNTNLRKIAKHKIDSFATSVALPNSDLCDISLVQ